MDQYVFNPLTAEMDIAEVTKIEAAAFDGFLDGEIEIVEATIETTGGSVKYSRVNKTFVYDLKGVYYRSWMNVYDYLQSVTLKPLTNKIFVYDGKQYMWNGTDLVPLSIGIGIGYTYIGTATPTTTPIEITVEDKVFYIAVEEGDYSNFGQNGITELTILKSDGGKWVKEGLGVPMNIKDEIYTGEQVQFEFGAITNGGQLVDNTIRCRSQRVSISGTSGNINFDLHVAPTLVFNSANAYLGETFVKVISTSSISYSNGVLTINYDGTYDNFIISYKHSDNSEISELEVQQCYFILNAVSIKQKVAEISDSIQIINQEISDIKDEIYTGEQVQFEFGAINVSNGDLISNKIRVRTKPVYFKQIEGTITLQYSKAPDLVTDLSVKWGYLGDTPIKALDNSTLDNRTFSFISDGTFDNIRFTLKHSDNSEITQSELEQCVVQNSVSSIEKINDDITEIKKELSNSVNPFEGLKYVALGDSITYGFIPRNYAGYPGQLDSYAKLAAQKLGMTFDNYGISGSTLASNPDDPTANSPMSRRFMNMPNNADIISVMGGTNDIRKGITLGTFTDRNDDTYYGALHVILGGLYKKYIIDQGLTIGKKKKIFICTPPKLLASSGGVDGGTGTLKDMSAWCDAIKEVAAYYSIPVLDFQNMSGINPHLNQTVHGTETGYTGWYNPYITDGTHPTQEGAEVMSEVLCGFLKTLI